MELKSSERDSRFLLESKSPEKDFRFPIELKAPERDSRFLLEDKFSEKHARFSSENRSPERESRFLLEGLSPEKESRFSFSKPQERESSRSGTPTPGRETPTRDIPTLRPSLRRPPQSILGENTPPQSATMLALQNMATKEDTTLSNVTNGSTALVRTPQTFDAISTQILNITSIATSLQREMAQLSRRSKDNATDLVSLKEATNARDEDIRKSLRELVASISESSSRASSTVYGSGGLFIDNKAHNSPSTSNRTSKQFTLPRIPSPSSFAASLDREVMISPAASYCHDGVTNIALLEKILREMSTREGQEQLAGRLLEVADRLARDGTTTAKKLDELLELLKDHHSQALVAQNGGGSGGGAGSNKPRNFSFNSAPILELDFDQPKSGPMTQRTGALLSNKENIGPPATRATEIINDDVVKLIRTIKDSVAQGGGLTAEVKALVRELRGEVLGMGREIGRKLEEADTASAKDNAEERDRVTRVVQDGLDDLKEHMDSILREHRRQSSASIASNRVDYQEIYKAVRIAVNEKQQRSPELQKEDIVQAVKEAWENYKPDIELQQFGLEREELLTCLKEGIREYCPEPSAPGATRDEVFTAVVEGLKHFVPPQVETQASLSRDEILDAVRECLEEFEFPSAPPAEPIESGITRDDMLDAVNEGLQAFDFAASTTALSRGVDVNLTRDDMLDAVKEGLHTFDFPINAPANDPDVDHVFSKEVVVEAVKEGLRSFDFAANTTALSRDVGESLTRHDVLDAVQEGLLTFDFTANTTALSRDIGEQLTRHDVLDAVQEGLHTFDFPATSTEITRGLGDGLTRDDVLDAINEGLNNFDFAATTTALTTNISSSVTRDDVLDAVKEGLHSFDFGGTTSTALTHDAGNGLSKEDVYEAVKAGLDDVPQLDGFGGQVFEKLQEIIESMRVEFQAVSDEAKQNVSASGRDTEQVLDATKDGFEKLRGDIETYVDRALEINGKDELLDRLRDSFDNLRTEVELLSSQGSSNSLDAVQSELEHLRETMATSLVRGSSSADKDEILDAIRASMNSIKTEIEQPRSLARGDLSNDKDEILEVLKAGLDSIRTELVQPQALVRGDFSTDKDEILDAIRAGTDSRGNLSADKDEILEVLRTSLDNIRTELAQPQALVRGDLGADKDEILEAVRASTSFIKTEMEQSHSLARGDLSAEKDEIIEVLRTGLENIQTQLEQPQALVRGDLGADKDEIIEVLRTGLNNLRTELEQPQALVRGDLGADKDEIIEALRAGLDSIRTGLESQALVRGDVAADKDEIIEILRAGLDNIRTGLESQALVRGDVAADKDEIIEVLRTGLNNIRAEVEQPQGLVREDLDADKDEILEALKNGLDSLRIDLDRNRDGSESVLSGSGEVLEALHDGLNSLRSDLEKIVNKPVDMTVNYEILDTLKLGLEGLRADIDRLRENGHGEQAVAKINDGAVVTTDSLKRNDIENLEVLITQLRIKVEAFKPIPPPPPQPVPDSLSKSDLEIVEDMLRNIQESIVGLSAKERSVDEDGVKRDDVISIETLLRNTKAKIDEIDPEQAVRKDHLDAVEILVSENQTTIKDLTSHLDDVSKRDDVLVVEGLVRDVLGSLEDMKERAAEEAQGADKPTKTDIEAVEKVCHEVKAAIEQMILSDISILATKEDVKNLEGLVKEFRGRAEQQEVAIYKGFEERQAETVGVSERVTEVKSFLEEFRDALKEKLDSGASSLQSVAALLESIGEKVDSNSADVADDVKEMLEVMKSEFEKSNAGVVGSKLESDEKFQQTWDRFDSRLDEKFDELMTKYDDAQLSAETKATMEDEKKRDIEIALLGTKAVAEDVKLLIDTLGTTLTESVEKMDESGRTVFNRVEDTFTRVEETHADAKAEHQLTREQVFKTIGGIEGVQSYLTEYNPKILESVKDVLLIVGQHYEHSKSSAVAIQEKIAEIPPPPEMPLIREAPPPVEKYDDTNVHEKLDKLVDHMHAAGKSFAQLEMLDKIHQQVMETAAEVSQFVSNQTQRIADDHENKEKAVEAATIALERKLAHQEQIEANVVGLRSEEERLKESVAILKAEQDDLAHQKMRLSADVSSLETALRIRREELHAMEARAEGLERRILEGVIDHSRALLISKSNKGRDAMSRKRVPSHATSMAGSVVSNATSKASTTHSAVSMAMRGNRGPTSVPINNLGGPSRRILSLNQITHNVPTGNFKRSHSVKTNTGAGALRKSSWGGSLSHKYGDLNKENLALKESEEDEDVRSDEEASEAGTMRRSSHGTTIMTGAGTGVSESTIDEGTEWTGSSHSDDEEFSGDEEETEHEPSQMVLYEDGGQVV